MSAMDKFNERYQDELAAVTAERDRLKAELEASEIALERVMKIHRGVQQQAQDNAINFRKSNVQVATLQTALRNLVEAAEECADDAYDSIFLLADLETRTEEAKALLPEAKP